MKDDPQRTLAANLLLERVELKRDIAALKFDLSKRAEALVKLGGMLRSNPLVIVIDEQSLSPENAQRAQKFSSDDLDAKRLATLVDELRTKTERLSAAEQEIKGMGYPID